MLYCSLVHWLHCNCRDHIESSGGHLEPVTEDMETMDDHEGEQQGLASSSSSEGDLELPAASGPSSQSPSRSRSNQPPKPAPPRQRPSIPPRPKENTATSSSSEGQLEPTPFDLPDPFQDIEKVEERESLGPADQGKKEQLPAPAPKPTRPPTMKKPQLSVDASTKVSQYQPNLIIIVVPTGALSCNYFVIFRLNLYLTELLRSL